MKIVDSQGHEISDLDKWRSRVFDGTSKSGHWKKGRSAYSLAEFIMDRQGDAWLDRRMSSVLSQHIELERATPEYLARFDYYPGNPSNLDLGVIGNVGRRTSLFVGVEAKVDETFGSTVGSRYSSAMKTRRDGKKTNAPERVKCLLSRYFADDDSPECSRFADIRYQLLTGTAGTVAQQKDESVFYVLVLKTCKYNERAGKRNQADYEAFMEAARGKPLRPDGADFWAHELRVGGKRLVCIYDHVDL